MRAGHAPPERPWSTPCGRPGAGWCWASRAVGVEGAGGRGHRGARASRRRASAPLPADAVVLATGGFASGGIELDSRGGAARDRRRPAGARPRRGRAAPLPAPLRPPAPAARRPRGRRADAPGRRGRGAGLGQPARRRRPGGGRRAVAREVRRGHLPRRRRRGRICDPGGGTDERDDRPGDDPRLARPLRQVHDLRDLLPGRRRDAPLPRPQVRGPPGRALPERRRPLGRPVARLLLELRHLHPGLPAGREDRGDQLAGPGGDEGRDGDPAARPPDRPPDADRPPRDAGRAPRQLDDAQPARRAGSLERTLGIHRSAPDAALGRPHAAGLVAAQRAPPAARARRAEQRRPLPRLRRQLLRARHRPARGRGARAQRARRDHPAARAAAGCRCRATASSPTRAATRASWPPRSPPTRARATTSSPPPPAAG